MNATTAAPSGDNLVDGFFRNAAATPEATALIARSGTLSYGELCDRVLAVAGTLQAAGVGSGDIVAVLGPKGAEQVPALLGILTAGAAYLPIGVDQPADRAQRMLATGGVRFALVCGDEVPDVLTAADVPCRRIADIDTAATTFDAVTVAPSDLAYVLFTSGSTGEPKGWS